MIYLTPSITVMTSLAHTTHHYPMYVPTSDVSARDKREVSSPGTKFAAGFFPWYGTVNNAHNIDRVQESLENLTAMMISGFGEFPPVMRAMRNMLMQHQMGLDLLLAAQGVLCHIIGTHCCTFIPDISGNITDTIHHLNLLLTNLKAQDVPEHYAGWDWWAWVFQGGWKAWLARFIAPLITLMFGFLICVCCIIPLVKKMISSIFMVNMIQYQALQNTESSDLFRLSRYDDEVLDSVSDTV